MITNKVDVEFGMIFRLSQSKLEEMQRKLKEEGKCLFCTGEFGAVICDTGNGLIIRSMDYDNDYGDANYYYEWLLTSKNTLLHFGEPFVITDIGYATITLQSRDNEEVKFWLTMDEFKRIPFTYIGDIDD